MIIIMFILFGLSRILKFSQIRVDIERPGNVQTVRQVMYLQYFRARNDRCHARKFLAPRHRLLRWVRFTQAIKLPKIFTLNATTTTLNPNASNPCMSIRRRIGREVTTTSDTCEVMPITNEK